MMKVSREQMAENRTRILNKASRLFRENGFYAVSVAEVMQAAGLTHGGFYGHFASKDDLFAKSLAHVIGTEQQATDDFGAFVDTYLSEAHRDDLACGCPTAALASETGRQSGAARAALSSGLKSQIDRIAAAMPGQDDAEKRRAAFGSWSAMVGAMILARSCDDAGLSDEILAQTRDWIVEKQG